MAKRGSHRPPHDDKQRQQDRTAKRKTLPQLVQLEEIDDQYLALTLVKRAIAEEYSASPGSQGRRPAVRREIYFFRQ
jgi:hypothetical protein